MASSRLWRIQLRGDWATLPRFSPITRSVSRTGPLEGPGSRGNVSPSIDAGARASTPGCLTAAVWVGRLVDQCTLRPAEGSAGGFHKKQTLCARSILATTVSGKRPGEGPWNGG